MYFCYDAYTFYTLHVSNAYFPKVCMKYTPTGRITPRPWRHHWASSMGSFPFVPPRHNQHARGAARSFQNCPSFGRAPVGTLTRGSGCLTVGEKKKKYFVLSIEVGADESRYRGHVSLSVASPSTTNAVYIHDFLLASFTVYLHFTPFDSHSLAYFPGRNIINGTKDIAVDVQSVEKITIADFTNLKSFQSIALRNFTNHISQMNCLSPLKIVFPVVFCLSVDNASVWSLKVK